MSFPEPKEVKLENGLRVIIMERPSLPCSPRICFKERIRG